jgi:transcriptional regulator with XRE-family HTH domain
MQLKYDVLASELLRALRGRRSQAALAQRLGYRANVAHTWERGTRFPPAQVLFRLAALNRISLEPLERFCGAAVLQEPGRSAWSVRNTTALLRALIGETPIADVARKIRVDRTTVARWVHGKTEPRIPHLLELIDATTHRLVEFVAVFADPEALQSVSEVSRDLVAQRRIAYELPWSHAVLRALELDEYRRLPGHVPGVVARSIGISVAEETRLLAALGKARLIRRRRGKWGLSRVLTLDTRTDPERDRRLKEHWAEVGLDRLRRGPRSSDAYHSYNLFAVSHADFARVRELHVEYFQRVRRIIAESSLAERVVLLLQELVPLDEQPEGPGV